MKFKMTFAAALVAITTQLFVGAPLARAEIREAMSMSEVAPTITQDTLVVFDIDNTILEPVQMLGSDQWFSASILDMRYWGWAEADVVSKVIREWEAVQEKSAVQAVEASTPALIRELQGRGIAVMALTARTETSRSSTFRQFAGLGVDMARTAPGAGANIVVRDPIRVWEELGNYLSGVLFVGASGDKGAALVQVLNQVGYKAKRIVFVDDKLKNTQSVDRALNSTSIPHIEFRYGAADPKVKAFDRNVADKQFKVFKDSGEVISDEKARELLKK